MELRPTWGRRFLGLPGRTVLRQAEVDQHHQQRDEEAEGIRHAVPLLRHPHPEPFTAHRHEAHLPGQEAQGQAGYCPALGRAECLGRCLDRPHQAHAADPAEQGGQAFQRDDEDVARVVHPGRGDGAVHDLVVGEQRVHQEHVAHEGEVGAVVGDVAEGDQGGEESHGQHHGGLGQADQGHVVFLWGRDDRAPEARQPGSGSGRRGAQGARVRTSGLEDLRPAPRGEARRLGWMERPHRKARGFSAGQAGASRHR